MPLYGRETESTSLGALLEAVRASRSQVLVIRGAAGAGKSALLEDTADRAGGMRVLRATGVRSEAEIAFAGLHQLVWPLRDFIGQLAPAQAAVLRTALGLAEASSPQRFVIGAAVLELLAAAAEDTPLLCVVDDAQWLDGQSADAIAFAARRLHAEPIGIVLATREEEMTQGPDLSGFRELHLGGLSPEAARALLEERAGEPLEDDVRDQVLYLARGNPLALLELPLALTSEQLSGSEPLPLTPVLEDAFLARARVLPPGSQRLLLLAAADTTGDPAVVLGAARQLGISTGDIDAAAAAGLLRLGANEVSFRHPLVRSATYESAPFSERSAAHRAPAHTPDPERRAWHQAAAIAGPDDGAADALADSAERASVRGGFGAAAAALRRAAALTTDPRRRARRLAGAAEAAWLAGRPASSMSMLHEARRLAADPGVLADMDYVQALIEIADATPADAFRRLVRAADGITATDPGRAQKLLLQAREAAVLSADTQAEARVSRQAEQLARAGDRFPGQFLGGMARWLEGDIAGAVPRLRDALQTAEQAADPRCLFWSGIAAFVLGDDTQSRQFFQREADQARSDGAVAMVAQALTMLASGELLQGRAASARASATEGLSLAQATAQPNIACFHLAVLARIAASFGTEDQARARVAECYEIALTRRLPLIDHMISVALGELELAHGRPDLALGHLADLAGRGYGASDPLMRVHAVPALIEASVRAGEPDIAAAALAGFADWFTATRSLPNLALLARMRALLSADGEADAHFDEALGLHGRSQRPFDRARTELLYGESLRRRRERRRARGHLRAALDLLELLGARPWAERARSELRASGETARRRPPGRAELLTPQELQVARFVAGGATSKEAAARLFLSPRTIDAHLRSIYAKLGITSRAHLREADLGEIGQPHPQR
jgi:DNA-binding CsgD family transcriptional regulator